MKKYIGKTFNKIKVKDVYFDENSKRWKFSCECHCGKLFDTRYDYVKNGSTKSCGCSKKDKITKMNKKVNYKKLPNGEAAFNIVYKRYKKDAEKRNKEFSLSKKEFKEITSRKCFYCNKEPDKEKKSTKNTGSYKYNGIDRFDNKLGYVFENCVPCCTSCNRMKLDKTPEEFMQNVFDIYHNQKIKNQFKEHKLASYMERAETVAKDSKDPKTKVGCLFVTPNDGAVVASGYNSYVRNVNDKILPKEAPDKYPYIVHAEENAILNSAKKGIATEGCIAVVTLSPCTYCMRRLWQCGITTIYFKEKYRDFDKQISMKDLHINLTQIDEYYKIELEVK